MNQTQNALLKKTTAILILLNFVLTFYEPVSLAFIFDKIERNADGTVKRDSDSTNKHKERTYDASCLSGDGNHILKLPINEAKAIIEGMPIERQVDLYLCSMQAGLDEIPVYLMDVLSRRLPDNLQYMTNRLANEHDEIKIFDLLIVFGGYGLEEFFKKISKNDDFLTVEELPFPPEISRLLVNKAGEIHEAEYREFILDYLIPLLPYDEALARQAQREEAQKKSGK